MGVEVDEELGGEERGEEGVDGVEGVPKLVHRGGGARIFVAGIEHVVVLGRDDVHDEVLSGARAYAQDIASGQKDSTTAKAVAQRVGPVAIEKPLQQSISCLLARL